MSHNINLVALEVMIRKMRLTQERFPDSVIAGVVFAQPGCLFIIPTVDDDKGINDLKECLVESLTKGNQSIKSIDPRDN